MDAADLELAGAAIAEARRAKRLSQGDVARALNVSQGSVSLWELGKAEPRMSDLVRLAGLLEIKLPTLLERMGIALEREWPSYREWYRERRAAEQSQVSDSQAGAWPDTLRQTRGSADSPAPKPASRQRNQGFSRSPAILVGAH